jgi:Ran GTPase-activating protein (RanGAP) involved in mRNA processing and transport
MTSFTTYFTQTLTTLDLEGNQIGSEGTKYLANALQQNTVKLFSFLHSTTH